MFKQLIKIAASVGGIGYIPYAPGTWASGAVAVIWWLVPCLAHLPWYAMSVVIALSVVCAQYAASCDGRCDPSWIVVDELVGMSIALWYLPHNGWAYAASFVLFRAFDIGKPLGIKKFEQLPGGWGIVCDDMASGIVTRLIIFIFTGF